MSTFGEQRKTEWTSFHLMLFRSCYEGKLMKCAQGCLQTAWGLCFSSIFKVNGRKLCLNIHAFLEKIRMASLMLILFEELFVDNWF